MSIQATGAGHNSNILAQGAQISAGNTVRLKADGDVVLKAAQNTTSESNSSKSSSASVGVSFGAAAGITASAGKASGSANGQSLTHTNTHVDAGQKVVIESGADTTLEGAVVSAKQVMASVGGNLKIESLQDTNTYQSKSKSVGGAIERRIVLREQEQHRQQLPERRGAERDPSRGWWVPGQCRWRRDARGGTDHQYAGGD